LVGLFASEGPARGGLGGFVDDFWCGSGFGDTSDGGSDRAAGVGEELGGEILFGRLGALARGIRAFFVGFDGEAKVVILSGDKFGLVDLENGLVRGAEGFGGGPMDLFFDEMDVTTTLHGNGDRSTTIVSFRGVMGSHGLSIGLAEGGIVE